MKAVQNLVGRGLALTVVSASCAVPAAPAGHGPAEPRFELAAYDVRGLGMALDALPRRPEFVLSSTRALEPVELVLLAGELDAELRQDLAALPLRAANDLRVVPSVVSQRDSQLRLAPREALDPAAAYTLALPGSARVRGGSALDGGGPAFVAALRTLGSASAGAAWIATLPAAGSSGVPTNLEAAFVTLDGAVAGDARDLEAGIWLEAPDGRAISAEIARVDCADLDATARTCVRLALSGELRPHARYALRSGGALRDVHGALIEPLHAWFDTGAASDVAPPGFEPRSCQPDEQPTGFGCLLVGDAWVEIGARADEPVRVAVRSWERQAVQLAAAGEVDLRLAGFAADTPFELELEAIDVAGNATEARVESISAPPLATLAVTEVLADPAGPDAAQEYVEIANFGAVAVELHGISLADASDKPTVIESEVELPAGARALLVAADFDPALPSFEPEAGQASGTVAPGVRLVRVGPRLTKAGLANAGESLFLRDSELHRLSAVPARVAGSGRCLQRRAEDPRSGRVEDFVEAACTPGR